MTEELKPCPFCSCTDIGEVTINPRLERHHRRFKVYCKACQCRTSEHKTRKEARIYWNTRAQSSQGGEAVEVVGYGCEGQIEVLKHVPLTGGMKVSGREREKYNVPLMTVAQHQRMMLALVARCYQEGAFKTCLECGYQDGHDLICQYHESKRTPSPDAELVSQCIAEELSTWEGDFQGPVQTAMRCLQVRIDAALSAGKEGE